MKETRYHIIKEQHIDLPMLDSSKAILKSKNGFNGSTHSEFRAFGQASHVARFGEGASFGYTRTKNGQDYWVLPYFYVPELDVVRKDEGNNIIAKTYTLTELNNFGFDEPEEI